MAYSKIWTFYNDLLFANTTDATTIQKTALLTFKNYMIAAGWTVMSSSNGTTYNASGDNWSAIADLVYVNSQASNRSWILLKSPVGFVAGPNGTYTGSQSQIYICLECFSDAATAPNYGALTSFFNINMYITPTSSGGINAIPTGGISMQATAPARSTLYGNWGAAAPRMSVGITSEGGIFATIKQSITGYIQSLFYILPLSNVGKYGAYDIPYGCIAGAPNSNNLATGNLTATIFDKSNGMLMFNHLGAGGNPRYLQPQNNSSPAYVAGGGAITDINGELMVHNIRIHNTVNGIIDAGDVPDFYGMGFDCGIGTKRPLTGPIEQSSCYQLFIPSNI